MERQRTSPSSNHLQSPKSLILLSFASSSLLFSFLFSLFALRFGRPLHLPFAFSIGGNGSAIAGLPVLRGGGAGVEVEEGAFLGGGSGGGGLGDDSAVEGDRRGRAGELPVDSAVEVEEAVLGGGYGENPADGALLEGTDVTGAGNYSLTGLDSPMEVKGVVPVGGDGEKLAKGPVVEKPISVEGENLSKDDAGSAMRARSSLGNDSASQGAAASLGNLERPKSAEAVNFSSMDASGPSRTKGEFLHPGRVGGNGDSSVQGADASQQARQWTISNHSTTKNNSKEAPIINRKKQDTNLTQEAIPSKMDLARSKTAQCDVYDGRWVFDDSYPLYTSNSCPFVDEGFSCEANGRMDKSYRKWRWQPTHCSIPRFDARKMLEMLRGKRLVFVGDSLNRNQWESMMCLLREAVSDPARIHEARGRRITKDRGDYNFKFLDYNCSVEYHVTHFLVHEGKSRIGQKRTRTLRIDTIDRSSSRWRGANVLVFNTAHWWSHHKTKAG
ncbi:hypothetical protein BRADI_1g64470v3 [Brachypodium distachyon]|nr:hypothetical protein BRADI_1g64470v3 [Brachypodium distachyon]